jgi:uncharacterized protein YgbK (DUF1537 family)
MLEIAVIADDITGAADTGIQFGTAFAPVYLMDHRRLGCVSLAQAPRVISVFTGSRMMAGADARREVAAASRTLESWAPRRVYKKIDSALRGHIGAELEAVMEALRIEMSFIAPAFVEQGRTTRGGVHCIQGIPVAQTEMGRDPVAPVRDSNLPNWIAGQSRFPVSHIGLDAVEGGTEALAEAIRRAAPSGPRHVTFDATEVVHLDRIARMAVDRFPGALLCGSAGLARSVVKVLSDRPGRPMPQAEAARRMGRGNLLFVCGSATERLRAQVRVLIAGGRIAHEVLRPEALLWGGAAEDTQALERVVETLAAQDLMVQIGTSAKAGGKTAPQALLARFADFTVRSALRAMPAGIFLSGGDTAAAVLAGLEVQAIHLEGEISSGLVCGTLIGGPLSGRSVVTKAGSFGPDDTLLNLHRFLKPYPGFEPGLRALGVSGGKRHAH